MTIDEALERIESFKKLEYGWDSYTADLISPVAIARAAALLSHLFVAPACDGTISIYLGPEDAVELIVDTDGSLRLVTW